MAGLWGERSAKQCVCTSAKFGISLVGPTILLYLVQDQAKLLYLSFLRGFWLSRPYVGRLSMQASKSCNKALSEHPMFAVRGCERALKRLVTFNERIVVLERVLLL